MINVELENELSRLVGAMCDGTITSDEAARLDVLVQQDAAAREFYNNYLFMHGELYSQHAAVDAGRDGRGSG